MALYFKAAKRRAVRDFDQLAWAVWQNAALTAYAPSKSSEFPKLDKFTAKQERKASASSPQWREQLAAVRGWVQGRKG